MTPVDTTQASKVDREIMRWITTTETPRLHPARRIDMRAMIRPRWQDRAACATADPEAWFPTGDRPPVRQVTSTCARCPVRRSCLATALLWDTVGIWAGSTHADRTEAYRLLNAGVTVRQVLNLLLHRPRSQSGQRSLIPLAPSSPPSRQAEGGIGDAA